MSLHRRLERLEGHIEQPKDEGEEASHQIMAAIFLDEVRYLRACRANGLRLQGHIHARSTLGW